MDLDKNPNDVLYEVSYEAGNRVGGIHTVLVSKAKYLKKVYKENYIAIGFYNKKNALMEVLERKPPPYMKKVFRELEKEGIKCTYGHWADAHDVPIILVDSLVFQRDRIDEINKILWEKYKIDSLNTWNDYREPVAWSYAVGKLIEKLVKSRPEKKTVAHFHEWLAGAGLLYLKMNDVKIGKVFTTHATTLGRTMASNRDMSFLDEKTDPLEKAYKYGVAAKHIMERVAAEETDVFTTVSDVVAEEVKLVLGKEPDVVTVNALDFEVVPSQNDISVMNAKYRKRMDEFIRAYFTPYYPMDASSYPVVFTAGRYEFENKGYDIFIDALGELNRRLKNSKRMVIAFLWVPRGTIAAKDEIVKNFLVYDRLEEILDGDWEEIKEKIMCKLSLGENIEKSDIISNEIIADIKTSFDKIRSRTGLNPPINAFQLSSREEDDPIIKKLRENGLENKEKDSVKVVFYPVYLNREDELLGLDYKEALMASDIGVMLSRYEPWGYMGHETAVYGNISIVTDYSGFGRFVQNNYKSEEEIKPVEVVEAVGKPHEDIVKKVADLLEIYLKMKREKRKKTEIKAYEVAKLACWEEQIKNYINSYCLALDRIQS
ncbi:MAG: glycogen/starch synthase [archaeon]|nr:MAG: glycogen/starch synthase [archaeon]